MPENIITTEHDTPDSYGGSVLVERGPQQACGRFLLANTAVIFCGGQDGKFAWLSTTYQRELQPQSVVRLIALLARRDRKYFAPRRRMFGFSSPGPQAREEKLIAKRRALLGTPAYQADRSARRKALAANSHAAVQTNGTTPSPGDATLAQRRRLLGTPALRDDRSKRRLVQGDSRQALQAAGAV